MIVTEIQKKVLQTMAPSQRTRRPRSSLERLEKKGLVEGDRKTGWILTAKGESYLKL